MKPRLEIFILACVMLGLAFMAGYRLLVDGVSVSSILGAAVMLTPHLMVAMLAASPFWVGLGLGGIGLTFSIPLQLLYRIEFGMVISGLLVVMVFLRFAFVSRKYSILVSIEDRLMAVVAVVILVRILYDHPGSARMGESGGLAEAFYIGLGVLCYFMMARLTGMGGWAVRSTFRLMLAMLTLVALAQGVIAGREYGWAVAVRSAFGLQLWFLCAMVLSWALGRANRSDPTRGPQILPYLVILGTMILSVVSPFRSRPVFAVGIVMAVAYVHGRLRRLGTVVLAGLGLVVLLWFIAGSDSVPFVVSRSLSTIMPVSETRAAEFSNEFKSSAEFGWGSDFRAALNQMAWARIRERPLAGAGFTFTREELIMQSYASGAQETLLAQLALSGIYHNVVLELAVFCGLPLAALFVIAYLISLVKFIRFAPGISDPDFRMIAAALLGFFVAESGQMLMNGGGRDFYHICMLLGAMRGLRVWVAAREAEVELAASRETP